MKKLTSAKKAWLLLAISLVLALSLAGCGTGENSEQPSETEADTAPPWQISPAPKEQAGVNGVQSELDTEEQKRISVQSGDVEIVFKLNKSTAAASLFEQLPLSAEVALYGSNEMIFYPTEDLDVTKTTPVEGSAGTLAYFAPWGNVVMYYGDSGPYEGLYELGEAVSGTEYIKALSGTVSVSPVGA